MEHPPPGIPESRKAQVPLRRHFKVCGIALTALTASLVLAEALQWWLLPAPHPLRRRPGPAVFTFHTDGQVLPGISGQTRFTTESHGFRFPREIVVPKPAGVYRIFCVGGSTTECTYLDDAEAWPARLEAELRRRFSKASIEVINAGFSGMTSSDHVEQIEGQILPLEADCIVLMAGMNDHLRRASLHEPSSRSWKRVAMDYSMTARRLIAAWRAVRVSTDNAGTYALDPSGDIYRRARDQCAATAVADDARSFQELPDPLPRFSENVQHIAELCHDRGVALVLVTHPQMYRTTLTPKELGLLWMRSAIQFADRQAPLDWHIAELDRLNNRTRELARQRGLTLVDAEALLPKSTAAFYDDCHLNVAGAALLAELVAESLAHARIPGDS